MTPQSPPLSVRPEKRYRRRRIITWSVTAAAVAVGITTVSLVTWYNSTPSPLGQHPSDVQRITPSAQSGRSLPPSLPTAGIRIPDGTRIGLILLPPGAGDGAHGAHIGVQRNDDSSHIHWHQVGPGDTVNDFGVRIRVIKVWRMPDWSNNAVDVQIDPA